MHATVTYVLTETAQRAAMVATGQPVPRKQAMVIEVSPADLPLLPVKEDGTITIDISGYASAFTKPLSAAGWETWNGGSAIAATSINPDFIGDLRRGNEIIATKAAEEAALTHANGEHNRQQTEIAYQKFLNDRSARCAENVLVRALVSDLRSPADWWPENHAEFLAEIKRRNELDAAAKRLAENARELAKSAYIESWMEANAKPELLEQYNDGLLERVAVLSMIADSAFSLAGVPDEVDYKTCDNRNCPCGPKEVKTLPTNIYSAWKAIKDRLPEGYGVKFLRVREHVDEPTYNEDGVVEEPAPFYVADISIQHGPFRFDRQVKLQPVSQ